ncbi:glycosyltransferase family 2 protein [Heterobasidion irregulare TC 32-1]|uniref:dolichyl-phosphate beta-glucosyltransferase n=1 Tax=Heterobasidion irregulare (strain TC 32-1) TaxID=747525 RepID=W4JYS6_HETIT|nr:glycosyltransferase family 2 protein [Heterobasidion irregulare TC 32-1]ETW78717.1 glycosyltransferase family 2 protein [Heterobasidion irregulare TC 32-1]
MDQNLLLCGGLLVTAILLAYVALHAWTPPPIVEHASEKNYRSRSSPKSAKPLPSLHDIASIDITVVIPAYNETARLPSMLDTAVTYLAAQKGRTYEILIVDDGSSDGTADKALAMAKGYPRADIRVVQLEKNLGKGGAVRHGMLHGRGEKLLMVDADGASRFEDLALLWNALDGIGRKGVAIGSRAHLVKTAAVVKRSFIRNFLMYGLHTVLRIVGVGHIRDTQCGFKLFTRAAAQQIFPNQHLTTWIFDVELLLLAKQLGIPVEEVPIEWHEVPGSKLNVMKDSLQMLRDLLVLRANMLLGRWKIGLKAKAE